MPLYPSATHRFLQTQYWTRTNAPWVLGVMHITGNPGNPPSSAAGEIGWRQTNPSVQNSATYYIDRDGAIFQALDPGWQVAWTNGDLNKPDTSHAAIKRILTEGINPNRACYFTAELVGREPQYPITDAQIRSFAALLRFHAPHAKLPITKDTVLGHRHFNSATRYGCPTAGNLNALLNTAIHYATEDEVADWHDDIVYVPPVLVEYRPETSYRKRPDLSAESRPVVLGYKSTRRVIGRVSGQDFGAGGEWDVVVSGTKGLLAVHPQDRIKTVQLLPGGGYSANDLENAHKAGQTDMKTRAVIAIQGLKVQ